MAETNRAPFDVAEGESEIVAGFHVEYGGMAFSVFFMAEYANMIIIAVLTSVMFFGGWLSPFQGIPFLSSIPAIGPLLVAPSIFWLLGKTSFFLFMFLWLRATFPRYRYDQIMRLGLESIYSNNYCLVNRCSSAGRDKYAALVQSGVIYDR